MKTLTLINLGLALSATAVAILLNAEMAGAILAAAGVLTIAVNDYTARRFVSSRLVA